MRDFDPLHDIMFRHLFLEERPQNLLLLLNGLFEYEGEEAFARVESVERRCEYLNNRHSCEMATVLVTTERNSPCLILIALKPHPALKKYVLPLMLTEAEEMRKKSSASSLAVRGIIISSRAYNHLRKEKDNRNNPLYATREVECGQLLLTEINLFRFTSPFPRKTLKRREEWMYFLHYASIYLHAEPLYSLPLFLKGSLSAIWDFYRQVCADEQFYRILEDYRKACLDENTELASVIMAARNAGEKEAREFLRTELEAMGIDEQALTALITNGISR